MLLANVRHEYYEARRLGGYAMRSLQQMRVIDCQRRLNHFRWERSRCYASVSACVPAADA